jgi:glutamate synthase (NADPH) large chain
VLDETGDFESRLNKEMVKLEEITADKAVLGALSKANGDAVSRKLADVMLDMREQDAERLHALISRHAHYTNSRTAQAILKDFAAYLPKFKKVMPVEYRRALTDLAKARDAVTAAPAPATKQ